jgi:hypothetical protein
LTQGTVTVTHLAQRISTLTGVGAEGRIKLQVRESLEEREQEKKRISGVIKGGRVETQDN